MSNRRRQGAERREIDVSHSVQQEDQHAKTIEPKPEGLIGFFGHTFVDENGRKRIQYQFRVLRAMPPDRWIVQYYDFFDGCPNKLAVYSESFLLSNDCALYPDAETWRAGYDDYYAGSGR
jgi:hypothetical protein